MDTILNIIPTDSCPPIIQTVADITDAVDGTVVGQLTVERYIDSDGNQHIHLYEWDGTVWVEKIETSFRVIDSLIELMDVSLCEPNYQISVDGGVIWDSITVAFVPPVASVETWFRTTDNGCVYTNLPIIPLEITYCVEYSLFDNNGDPTFLFGTINGADAGDAVAVTATYANWEGNATTIAIYDPTILPALIILMRDSLTPPFVNFGTFQDILANPPVTIPIDTVSCVSNCYQAIFNSTDLSTEGLTAISAYSGNNNYDWGAIVPFDDPDVAALNLAGLITAGFLEPTATLEYSFNGLEVTVTICTVKTLYQFSWGTDSMNLGTANFTQL